MSDNVNIVDTEIQAARATLREKFLRTLLALKGKTCTINTHEMNKVEGVFKGFDVDLRELLFDNLKTPYSDIPHSIVRAEDILFIEFPEEIETNVNN